MQDKLEMLGLVEAYRLFRDSSQLFWIQGGPSIKLFNDGMQKHQVTEDYAFSEKP